MKVVAFNGSPRHGGNTEAMLKIVLAEIGAAGIETELVQVGGLPVGGCRACMACREKRDCKCIFDRDIVNSCIAKMIEADAILLGSPTYFADMTPELKALIDRAGYVAMANGRIFERKVGAAIAVQRRGGAVNVVDSINRFFLINGMIIPGSTYWNFANGRNQNEAETDAEGVNNMRDLGVQIAWLLQKIHA